LNSCISTPSVTAESTQRPVMTTCAPASSAAWMGRAPRYALAVSTRSGSAAPLCSSRTGGCAWRSCGSSADTSSPLTTAIFNAMPCSLASAASASAQPCGFTPPALLTTRMPCFTTSFSTDFIATETKSVA
jgi:hypothetical protein